VAKYNKVNIFSWIILGLMVASTFITILLTAVNMPFWDEWDVIRITLPDFSLEKLFALHNEHRIVFSRLLIYINYYLNDLNIRYLIIENFFIYTAAISVLYIIVKRFATDIPYLPIFFIPLFSPRLADHFLWSTLNSFNFTLLFGLLAVYFGFIRESNNNNILLMLLFLLCSTISMSFAFPFGIMVAYIIKEILNIFIFKSSSNKIITIRLGIIIFTFLLIISLPFYFFNTNLTLQASLTYPNNLKFWLFFLHSYGFSVNLSEGKIVSIISAILMSIPLLIFMFNKKEIYKPELQAYFAIILAVLSSISAIAIGRAFMSESISNRHYSLFIILVPIISVLLIKLYRKYKRVPVLILCILYFSTLSFHTLEEMRIDRYFNIKKDRLVGVECAKSYYDGTGSDSCKNLYPRPMVTYFDKAKELNLSFTK